MGHGLLAMGYGRDHFLVAGIAPLALQPALLGQKTPCNLFPKEEFTSRSP